MLTFDNNPGLLQFNILQRYPEVLDFVTTRQRPDGSGCDFNIGYSGGSHEDCVNNRLLLAKAVGIEPECFVFQNQIHGSNVSVITEGGAGFYDKESAIKDNDVLVTNVPNICIVTRSADCIPVLLYSPDTRSCAAVHSGREGTYLGAAVEGAKALVANYNANPSQIVACIGPGICANCYEVDMDCAAKFVESGRFPAETYTLKGEKAYLDLKKMIFYDLLTYGLVANNIEISDICTKCANHNFYSARMGDKQRFCAGICIIH
ncbi:MAG: polyphenol oxidase family protein [Bacteroidales bacterium]|nr:polyphenol oxidase family protein [Bacteroidales bacterium]